MNRQWVLQSEKHQVEHDHPPVFVSIEAPMSSGTMKRYQHHPLGREVRLALPMPAASVDSKLSRFDWHRDVVLELLRDHLVCLR